jgi:hypothetical protein
MKWKNENEIYEYIGRFCVEFEQMCRSMEACIRTIIHDQGLNNDAVSEILLSNYTAEPLRKLLQNLIGQTVAKGKKEHQICSRIFTYIQNLTENRNYLIHSKWYLYGLRQEEEVKEVYAFGVKLHANKKGVATKKMDLDKSKLDEYIKQCKEASIMISLLMRCVMNVRNLKDCFKIEAKELVINYEMLKAIVLKKKV